MERRLKERLTGAAVLVMIAVIFIPMVLDNSHQNDPRITRTNIPPKPESSIRSRIIPLEETREETPVRAAPTVSVPEQLEPVEQAGQAPSTDQAPATIDNNPRDDENSSVPNQENSEPETVQTRGLTAWVVQLGSFASEENAKGLAGRLQAEGYAAYIEEITDGTATIFRVRVGPELSRSDAERTLKILDEKYDLEGILLQYP